MFVSGECVRGNETSSTRSATRRYVGCLLVVGPLLIGRMVKGWIVVDLCVSYFGING